MQRRIAIVLCLLGMCSTAWAGAYNFSGEIVNPNATIPVGDYGNLTGAGKYGWQTGTCAKDLETNGFTFTLDSGNGNALNYSGVISGAGDVHFRMAPYWSGLANNPLILSGTRANTYAGTSYIEYGRVQMQRSDGMLSLPGNVVVGGQGDNDRLRWGSSNQVGDASVVTLLGSHVATLDLNGFSDRIGSLSLPSNGVVDTGSGGVLTTGTLVYSGSPLAPGTYTSSLPFILGSGQVVVLSEPERGTMVGLNFAGASNNPGGRKALAAGTLAGAPGFEQANWNNTTGTGQTGTPSSANDTLVDLADNKALGTTLDITFTSPQTWGENFGSTPTGDQQLNGNGITDGTPTVNVSQVPFDEYSVVVYMGMYSARNSTYTLNDGTTLFERYVSVPTWASFDTTGWVEVSADATSAALREAGNYTVFEGLTADSFTVQSIGGGGINAIQIINTAAAEDETIPEPLTAALALLAAGPLAGYVRRRQGARCA